MPDLLAMGSGRADRFHPIKGQTSCGGVPFQVLKFDSQGGTDKGTGLTKGQTSSLRPDETFPMCDKRPDLFAETSSLGALHGSPPDKGPDLFAAWPDLFVSDRRSATIVQTISGRTASVGARGETAREESNR